MYTVYVLCVLTCSPRFVRLFVLSTKPCGGKRCIALAATNSCHVSVCSLTHDPFFPFRGGLFFVSDTHRLRTFRRNRGYRTPPSGRTSCSARASGRNGTTGCCGPVHWSRTSTWCLPAMGRKLANVAWNCPAVSGSVSPSPGPSTRRPTS